MKPVLSSHFRTLSCFGTLLACCSPLAMAADADLFSRERLTGDWGGARTDMQKHGLDLRLEWTEFYHGLVEGTPDDDVTDGGKLDFFLAADAGKLGLCEGLFLNVHGEYRFGNATTQAGFFAPVNTAMTSPRDDGDVFAFTNVALTKTIGEHVMITAGKLNTVDLFASGSIFMGGRGVEGFMNCGFVAPLIAARTVPLSTLGVIGTWHDKGVPVFNLGVLDARSPAVSSGFDGLSSDEMTIMASYILHTKWGGLDGTHTFSATWSTINAVSLDGSDFIQPPGVPITIPEENESWQINYMIEHFLCQDGSDPKKGWGVFGYFGVSDGNPNPMEWSALAGISAKGVHPARLNDNLGLGFFYNGLSGDIRTTLARFVPVSDAYGLEAYYDCAITPWFRLGADVQYIKPAASEFDNAVYLGLRSRVIF